MATGQSTPGAHSPQLRDEWLKQLRQLVVQVNEWAQELGWSTREIDKSLQDSVIGKHKVPVLLLQQETVRVLLEPIARSAPGADGVVDLYLLPAYDDIASLYFSKGVWHLHYMFPNDTTVATIRDAKSTPLSRESLQGVLTAMKENAG